MYHFTRSGRGFSFRSDEPLDMRLDAAQPSGGGRTAESIVNELPREDLANLIYQYGEERYSRRIAERICRERENSPITRTAELAEIVAQAVPREYRYGKIHPATRTFQALRIAVNGELDRLRAVIPTALASLAPRGRLGVISFHSLEDRIVKHSFRAESSAGSYRLITKKPIIPSPAEVAENPASRSAKLRVIERMEDDAA